MELNLNSWSAKLYRWFYVKNEMPPSLCVYFWELIIAIVFSPFFFVLFIPSMVISLFIKDYNNEIEKLSDKIFINLITYLLICCVILMVYGAYTILTYGLFNNDTFRYDMQMTGIVLLGILILFSLYFLVSYLFKKITKSNKTNIIKEYVKAKVNGFCPKINWRDNK